jgi:hypothetical protein
MRNPPISASASPVRRFPHGHGGLRYCIKSAALRSIGRDRMASEGYEAHIDRLEAK